MTVLVRQALPEDIPAMHRVRLSVRENQLTSAVVTEADYIAAIEHSGRGWIIEVGGAVVGFAIGNAQTGKIWALFVDPSHEGRGYGRQLHDELVSWMWSLGLERLWLTTAPGTRAERFYESAGWVCSGETERGEKQFELSRPATATSVRLK